MDLATLVGIIIGVGSLLASLLLEGGHLSSLVNIPALVLIVGGSLGATMVSFQLGVTLRMAYFLKEAFMPTPIPMLERAKHLVELSVKARRDGLLALEKDVREVSDQFFKRGLQLVVDGMEPEFIKEVLEAEMLTWEERERMGEKFFQAMGGYSPTMGIMGAVLGLMHALGKSEDPSKMASAIAVAFVATLYGVGLANLVMLPISNKLKARVEERRALYEMTLVGLLAIQSGENPRLVAEKLIPFLPPVERQQLSAEIQPSAGGTQMATEMAA